MNKKEEQLFDLINNSGHDMEDLIETISYKEVDRLIEVWTENLQEVKVRC